MGGAISVATDERLVHNFCVDFSNGIYEFIEETGNGKQEPMGIRIR